MNDVMHPNIQELLPDHAIGALEPAQAARVARHLEECPACRQALGDLLETVGLLAPVPVLPPRVRVALLERVAAREAVAPVVASVVAPGVVAPPEVVPTPLPARPPARPERWRRLAARGALAAAAVLLLAFGGWNVALQRQLDQREAVVRLLDNPAAAHALTDGELPDAQGVFYAVPDGDTALLLASGLPALPPDRRYQLWLFAEDGARESGGLFAVAADGTARVTLRDPAGFARYAAVAVSPEPAIGSAAPTGPLVLGGWIR